MDRSTGNINDNSVTEEQRENEANAAIEAEMSRATEAATQPVDDQQNTEGDNTPLVPVGKRPGEPNPTEDQPQQKKPKLEENQAQDVASAAPPQNSNEQQKNQVSFNAPKTPPGTSNANTTPVAASGIHLNLTSNQGNSPVGPRASRLIENYDLLYDPVDSFFASAVNSDNASDSETGSETDEEFAIMCAKEAEGAMDDETSSEGSVAGENTK